MEALFVQQGDLAIKSGVIPDGKRKLIPSGVLVESAVTNHTHRVAKRGAKVFKIDGGSEIYIEASRPFQVIHGEHKPLLMPPGTYRTHAIMEYDHFAEEARAVAD